MANPATQENVARLRERGVFFVGRRGRLASGGSGPGRMVEPCDIFEAAVAHHRLRGPSPAGASW